MSGRVQAGDTLHLRYFVSGVVTATRDHVARKTIAPYSACKDATHFVWAYNLGAFELTSGQTDRASASAKLGSAGAGGSSARDEDRLKHGGDLASCSGEAGGLARSCQVPIRLALRPVSEVDDAPSPIASSTPASQGKEDARAVLLAAVTKARDDNRARMEARRKNELGDGEGCLADLDRLDRERRSPPEDEDELRSKCEMRAGRCNAGKARLRAYLEREAAEAGKVRDIDRELEEAAAHFCQGAQGTPRERVQRAEEQILAADRRGDASGCLAAGTALLKAMGELPKNRGDDFDSSFQYGYAARAVQCVAKAGRCSDARSLSVAQFKLSSPGAPASAAEEQFRISSAGTPCGGGSP